MAERPTEPYLFISGGRAEPTKKLFKIGNLCGACSTLVESNIIESGRAEQSTKVIGFGFVDAHAPLSWSHVSLRVDVPRFELGNRIAERIRCYILGFQFAQRINHLQKMRFGGEQ